MKFGELVTVFSVLFLVTFSMGDGAPQWRPQGRFGKRLDQRFPSPWQQSKYTHNINFTLHLFTKENWNWFLVSLPFVYYNC